jgi:DNA-binding CsgD family transcriptional regulator/PAS domain-containing protein
LGTAWLKGAGMRGPLAVDALSGLIGSIYDCAIEPERWANALEHLRVELDFANASLSMVAMPSGAILLNVLKGPEPCWVERAGQYGREVVEQWGGAASMQGFALGEPLVLSRIRPRSEWENDRFYREWARPQGIHDLLAILLIRDSGMVSSLGFGRHDRAGEISDLEIAAARMLSPHLRHAVTINRLLDLGRVEAATFEATLNALAVAVLLTDCDLRIVHANAAADAILRTGDPVACRAGVLSAPAPILAALAKAVRQAADREGAVGRRGVGIAAPLSSGQPCMLHVLPLTHGALRAGLAPAAAAIFVKPAASPALPRADAVALLFHLTECEARVFCHITSGRTQAETAKALGIAPCTVKTHLLNVFGKTGTRRQADLVRLAASLAPP